VRKGGCIAVTVVAALAVLVGAPPIAAAAEPPPPPTVTSVTPHEVSSGQLPAKIAIEGTGFEEVVKMFLGSQEMPVITGPLKMATCRLNKAVVPPKFECLTPGAVQGRAVLILETSTGARSSEKEEAGNTLIVLPELYRNGSATVHGSHIPAIGYGQMQLTSSPHPSAVVQCVALGIGAGWNEGTPLSPHAEILAWGASAHTPQEEHTELSSRCRFVYEGKEESERGDPEAWVLDEPRLHKVEQQGVVCLERRFKELSECPNPNEREVTSVITSLTRERLTAPWNVLFTEREGRARALVGLPEECETLPPHPLPIPCSEAKEPSERRVGTNPEACVPHTGGPAPAGCVRVTVVSTPPLNVELPYEGYLEPRRFNGVSNGLTPGAWEFEGAGKEPCLVLATNPTTTGCVQGVIKILGSNGQELLSIR
jgi:hypothetical protein